jgi:hypothetical protein
MPSASARPFSGSRDPDPDLERPNVHVVDAVVSCFDSKFERQEPYSLTDEPV